MRSAHAGQRGDRERGAASADQRGWIEEQLGNVTALRTYLVEREARFAEVQMKFAGR